MSSYLEFAFFSIINYLSFNGIDKALAMGLSIKSYEYIFTTHYSYEYRYWFDLFVLNNIVEATC